MNLNSKEVAEYVKNIFEDVYHDGEVRFWIEFHGIDNGGETWRVGSSGSYGLAVAYYSLYDDVWYISINSRREVLNFMDRDYTVKAISGARWFSSVRPS